MPGGKQKMRGCSEFCCHRDAEDQVKLPVAPPSDKIWTLALGAERFHDSADLQRQLERLRKRSARSPGRWKRASPVSAVWFWVSCADVMQHGIRDAR